MGVKRATGNTIIYADRNTGNKWGAKLQKYKKKLRKPRENEKQKNLEKT